MRRGKGANRFDQKSCRPTVKHSASIMVWGMFDGRYGRGDISFVPRTGKNRKTMDTKKYITTLQNHFLRRHIARGSTHLLQDSAPCHKSKAYMKWIRGHGIEVIKWPGNSPDRNPIENLWSIFKGKLEGLHLTSVPALKEEIKRIWREEIPVDLCKTLASRLQAVLDNQGGHTKY